MTTKTEKLTVTKFLEKKMAKLAGGVQMNRHRLSYRLEQIYLWSVFRFYVFPLTITGVLEMSDVDYMWAYLQKRIYYPPPSVSAEALSSILP